LHEWMDSGRIKPMTARLLRPAARESVGGCAVKGLAKLNTV
jgi:hypothetical protein